jgi:opacity protein-like surface antigen
MKNKCTQITPYFIRYFIFGISLMLLSLATPHFAYTQAQDTTITITNDNSDLEELIEDTEDDEFVDDTYNEVLYSILEYKLNINFATREQMEALDLLSSIQIQNIIFYRDKFGFFKSPYELLGIEELTYAEIQRILPYFTFSSSPSLVKPLKEQFQEGKHSIFLRYTQVLEEKAGFSVPDTSSDGSLSSRYLGIEPRLYFRYRFQYSTDLSIGITAEQDSGEPFQHPNQKMGLDYLSGHLFLKNRGVIKKLVVGDYAVNLGQGLFMQQSFGTRKSSFVTSVKKKKNAFKPHTSANEAIFSRGAAIELQVAPKWSIMGFGSYRKVDANTVFNEEIEGLEDEPINVSSLQISGLHRTESELTDKGANDLWSTGGSVSFDSRNIRLSANAAYFKLKIPLVKADAVYNKYDFQGRQLINASLDYEYLKRNMSLYGEIAISDNGGWGMINGANFNLLSDIKLTIAHRYYAKDFQTFYGNAFGESTRPVNENGVYVGFKFSPFKYAEWSSYIDIYQHPWLKFGIDAPSKGIDIVSKFDYRPKRWISMYVRVKYERKDENAPENATAIDYLVPTTRGGIRFHFQYNPNSNVSLKSRVEFAWYNDGVNPRSKGILAYQDISYTFNKFPMSLHARYALFQTDTYDSRMYAYENDLLYVVSIPAYYGRGSRYYLSAKIDVHRHIDFWIKWSQTIFTDRDIISSGLEEIDNNTRSEIKLQVRFRF